MKEGIFISTMLVILLFNTFIVFGNPEESSLLNINIENIVITAVGIILVGSLTSIVMGEEVMRKAFAIMLVFNVLFKIDVAGFTIGLGLTNNLIDAFAVNDVMYLGTITTTLLSIMAFFSGMLIVVES